jgi:hypothetical protein
MTMATTRSKVREPQFVIAWEIERAIVKHRAILLKMTHFADEVVEKAKEFAPSPENPGSPPAKSGGGAYATGEFVDSIHAVPLQGRDTRGRFISGWSWRVGSDDPKANLLEYGTGPDRNGIGVWQDLDGKWHKSPMTPTPEFATFGKTAMFFHTHGGLL